MDTGTPDIMYRSADLDMGSSHGETIRGCVAGSGRKSGPMTSVEDGADRPDGPEAVAEERVEVNCRGNLGRRGFLAPSALSFLSLCFFSVSFFFFTFLLPLSGLCA